MKHLRRIALFYALLAAMMAVVFCGWTARADDASVPMDPELVVAYQSAVAQFQSAQAVLRFAAQQMQAFCEKRGMQPDAEGTRCVQRPLPAPPKPEVQ